MAVTTQESRSVRSGTVPVDNKGMEAAMLASRSGAEEETQAEAPAEGVEGAAPSEQGASPQQEGEQTATEGEQGQGQKQEAAPAEGEEAAAEQQQEQDPVDRMVNALLERMQTKQDAQTQAAEEPQDVAFEQEIEQQREEVTKEFNEQIAQVDQQKQDLQKRMEDGDLDVNQYLKEADQLNESKNQLQRQMDRQLVQMDSQLERHKDQINQQIEQARSQYVQSSDVKDRWDRGEIQQAMKDPFVRNVFGIDNPAAINEYLGRQELAKENESLKQQLAEAKKAQESAVKTAATNPGQKVASSSGVQRQQGNTPGRGGDGMLEAMRSLRG